jgi:ABC-type antimicrobial peptide transport system ATPase subunit
MKRATKTLIGTLLLIGSASAMAAPHLTPQQCNDYPFKPLKTEVTHKQLMRELNELEAVGYNPDDANTYPDDLEDAQQKLQAEYRADCMPAAPHVSANAAGAPAGSAPAQAANQPAG